MNNKTVNFTIFVLTLLLIIPNFIIGISNYNSYNSYRSTCNPAPIPPILYVGGTGPSNYSHIQDAIDNASGGATIFVYEGIYQEHIHIMKTLTITGASQKSVIIDGNNTGTAIALSASSISLYFLTIKCSGGASQDALVSTLGENISIYNCTFEQARTGILSKSTSEIFVANSIFFKVARGITLSNSTHGTIFNCTFYKNGIGILVNHSNFINISNCYGTQNGLGLMTNSSTRISVSNCTILNSNENQGGIEFEYTDVLIVSNCRINHCGFGIRFFNCANITMISSQISDCKFGVDITENTGLSVIESSNIYNNDVGVYLFSSSHIFVHDNNIYSNCVADLFAKKSTCDARHNFWGDNKGPFGKVHTFIGIVRTSEWLRAPIDIISSTDYVSNSLLCCIYNKEEEIFNCNPENDNDGDKIPDWWEQQYGYNPLIWDDHVHRDPDGDGLNNVEEYLTYQYNSHPFKQDIFIEIDAMNTTFLLSEQNKQELITRFFTHNITLHIDDVDSGGGEIIAMQESVNYAALVDLYWTYFLHENPCSIRKDIFHYVILCNSIVNNMPGFVFIGWDEADSFTLSLGYYEDHIPRIFIDNVKATVFMHEFGHTLGLFHEIFPGIDNESTQFPWLKGQFKYHNYKSCMNYKYAWQILDYSDGSHGEKDFNDWANIDLTFFKNSHWGS